MNKGNLSIKILEKLLTITKVFKNLQNTFFVTKSFQ